MGAKHTAAYFESQTPAATFAQVNALTGVGDRVSNNNHVFNRDWLLSAAVHYGGTLTRARLRVPNLVSIRDWQFMATEPSANAVDGMSINDLRDMPLTLKRETEYEVDHIGTGGVAEDNSALLFLSDGEYNATQGLALSTRLTTTTVSVADAWSNVALTVDDTFPPGMYALNAFDVISATIRGYRLRFPGEENQRAPGGIGRDVRGSQLHAFDPGRHLGELGKFGNVTLFTVELFTGAAETATEFFAHCVGPF